MEDDRGVVPQPQIQVRTPSGCYRAGAISCAVVFVGAVLMMLAGSLLVLHNPRAKRLVGNAQLFATCQEQLRMVGQALQRYETRYERYPDRLADLYPTFLTDKRLLRCPADHRKLDAAIANSYTYVKPAPGAPGDTPVVMCRRHVVLEGAPPLTLILRKDGQVAAPTPSSAPPAPAASGKS